MYKKLFSIICLLFLMSTGIAKDCLHGENVIVIVATNNGGADRSSSISITLEETILTVAFLDNIGQVSIRYISKSISL